MAQVLAQVREKLRLNCAAVQIPLGVEDEHRGLVDLLEMCAYEFHGTSGEHVREARWGPVSGCRALRPAQLTFSAVKPITQRHVLLPRAGGCTRDACP